MYENTILYIRDKTTRSIISVQEGYLSLTWTERYQEAGDFVLQVPVTSENLDLYQEGRYVSKKDTDESMVIETIDITESFGGDEEPVLEIKGRTLSSLLSRRVNASRIDDYYKDGLITYSGYFNDICEGILNDDAISPKQVHYVWGHKNEETGVIEEGWDDSYLAVNTPIAKITDDSSRAIPNLSYVLDSSLDLTSVGITFSKFMSIYDILISISKRYVTGFKVVFDSSNNFVVKIYNGADRTTANKTLDPVIFDPIMDNISYVNYFKDYTDYKNYWMTHTDNYIIIPKEKYEEPQSLTDILLDGYAWDNRENSSNFTGFERIETIFDASSSLSSDSLSSDYQYVDSSGAESEKKVPVFEGGRWVYPEEKALLEYGQEQMLEGDYDFVEVSEGAIDPLVRYTYGKDYNIGDKVEITRLNNSVMIGIIDEVVFSYDSDGITVTPNFANMQDYDHGEEDAS